MTTLAVMLAVFVLVLVLVWLTKDEKPIDPDEYGDD